MVGVLIACPHRRVIIGAGMWSIACCRAMTNDTPHLALACLLLNCGFFVKPFLTKCAYLEVPTLMGAL